MVMQLDRILCGNSNIFVSNHKIPNVVLFSRSAQIEMLSKMALDLESSGLVSAIALWGPLSSEYTWQHSLCDDWAYEPTNIALNFRPSTKLHICCWPDHKTQLKFTVVINLQYLIFRYQCQQIFFKLFKHKFLIIQQKSSNLFLKKLQLLQTSSWCQKTAW
jgi:hypothetical protein